MSEIPHAPRLLKLALLAILRRERFVVGLLIKEFEVWSVRVSPTNFPAEAR